MKDHCDCVSYELDPSPNSVYTIQSAKFALEAKKFVRVRLRPSLRSKSNKSSNLNDGSSHSRRKVVTCFPFKFILRHKKVTAEDPGEAPVETEIILQDLRNESSILRLPDIQRIGEELPARAVGIPWKLQFCSSRDGFSLHNLYRKLKKVESPVLLIIEDLDGRVFGALSSSAIKISDQYFGTSECFLFTCYPKFRVYKWHGDNFYFVRAQEDFVAFGSGMGHSGLWFDSDLNKGHTDYCLTYGNPPLIPELDFVIKNVECWTFG